MINNTTEPLSDGNPSKQNRLDSRSGTASVLGNHYDSKEDDSDSQASVKEVPAPPARPSSAAATRSKGRNQQPLLATAPPSMESLLWLTAPILMVPLFYL